MLTLGTLIVLGCGREQHRHQLLVRDVRIVDPAQGVDIPRGFVVCSQGRIVTVGRGEFASTAAEVVIDGDGKTLVPGLVDAHVHLSGIVDDAELLKSWPRGGVTSVIELGGFVVPGAGGTAGPRVFRAGPILTAPNGYPDLDGSERMARYVDSPAAAVESVRELARRGQVDLIKIAVERGFLSDVNEEGWPVPDAETVEVIASAAHGEGLNVAAHLTQVGELRRAIFAGVDVIAHTPIDPLPDDLIEEMVRRNVVIISTLSVWASSELLEVAGTNLRRYVDAGGTIAMGTDSPAFQRPGHPSGEIELLLAAGFGEEEVLAALTGGGGAVLGRRASVGALKTGYACDLLLIEGTPLEDLKELGRPGIVLIGGSRIDAIQ